MNTPWGASNEFSAIVLSVSYGSVGSGISTYRFVVAGDAFPTLQTLQDWDDFIAGVTSTPLANYGPFVPLNATITDTADVFTGTSLADDFTGTAADEYFNKTVPGGPDTIDGGDGVDTVNYSMGGALSFNRIRLDLEHAHLNTRAAAGDELTNVENIIGTRFADNLRGNAADNLIIGDNVHDPFNTGAMGDWLFGRAGNDTLMGGTATTT